MRPLYETTENRSDELAIALQLRTLCNCDIRKLKNVYRVDYAALRNNRVIAWIEIKRRHRTFDQYPDCYLSFEKAMFAQSLHLMSKLPCTMVVQFDDCLAFADMLVPGRQIEFAGRFDRGDWQDVEPIVLVPMAEFRILKRA
jgi:hypothetical protein